MPQNKFYAYSVPRTGRSGIAESWKECEKFVKGEKDARFKGFKSRKEADDWLEAGADYSIKKKLPKGVYFDAGTGRGQGVEVSVTDENGKDLLCEIILKKKLNRFGKLVLPKDITNNYGELLGCEYAIKLALKNNVKKIFGDSRLVIDYWSKGYMNMKDVMPETIELAYTVSSLRKEFERKGGSIEYISGEDNPADLGFHR